MNPCAYCIEETCGGTYDCDCESCEKRDSCPKVLRPTVRITTRCTQACGHCCFRSGPDRSEMMTVETARAVADFLDSNDIWYVALMGGEIFCNPDWAEIVNVISAGRDYVRVVTNGDWAGTDFLGRLEGPREKYTIAISRDRWHTNRNVDAAIAECEERGFRCRVTTPEEDNLENIVPAGRGDLHYGLYSSFGCYCRNPEKKYTFLIDEGGEIHKCGFGVWGYSNVSEYREGGFAARFKEFNRAFYGCFVSNCAACLRAYRREALAT
jgi:hypothetical protein